MRALFGIATIAVLASAIFAADVRDLGVPGGWRASDYERHGYDLLNKHDYENARRYFDAAIRIDPYMWTAYYNRAVTFWQQKNWTAALQDLNSVIRLKPSFFDASVLRVAVNAKLSNYNVCLADLSTLVKVAFEVRNHLEQAYVLNGRAWLRATCPDPAIRNAQLALADAKRACELSKWKHANYIDTLAAACAEAGDFGSAVRYEEQAIIVNKSEPEKIARELATGMSTKIGQQLANVMAGATKNRPKEFAEHLKFYKQHRPYRETEWR